MEGFAADLVSDFESGGAAITVEVWMFGYLALLTGEKQVSLSLPKGTTAGGVIARLGQRFGPEFLEKVLDPSGEKSLCCRIFVNGLPLDDVDRPLDCGPAPAAFEMIMLSAYEGG